MNFTVGETIYQVDPENICLENKKAYYKESEFTVHDSFVDSNDEIVYLITAKKDNKLVWVHEHQIEKTAIKDPVRPVDDLDCNTYKGS